MSFWEAAIGSSLYLGLSIGAMSAGYFVKYGRRWATMLALLINLVGTGLVELETIETQLIGRVV